MTKRIIFSFWLVRLVYEHVGAAVDILLAKSRERGAGTPMEGLKIELTPTAKEVETCKAFGVSFVELVD